LPGSPPDTSHELADSIVDVYRAIERRRMLAASAGGLSVTDYRALIRIAEHDPITPKQLANLMVLTTGAVSALTDHLVAKGLILRTANSQDRRSLFLMPTPSGRTMLEGIYEEYYSRVAEAVDDITADDQRRIAGVLNSIASQLG
jgi:DNA-binding MarR family transcriptional regulator